MLAAPAGLRLHVATYKDYYQDHGRRSRREPGRDQARLSPARAQISSGRQQGSERGGQVQGSCRKPTRSSRIRRSAPPTISSARTGAPDRNSVRRPTGAAISSSPPRRSAAQAAARRTSAISSPRCSGSAVRSAAALIAAAAVAAAAASPPPAKITSRRSRSISKTHSAAAAQTIELKAPQLGDDGRVTVQPRTLKVTIPAGVIEGQHIRLAGQGSPGVGGGPAGDLYLEIGFRAAPAVRRSKVAT